MPAISPRIPRFTTALAVIALCGLPAVTAGCGKSGAATRGGGAAQGTTGAPDLSEAAAREEEARIDREWPLHGLVTGLQFAVRKEASPDAMAIGWLRIGSRVRLRGEPAKTPTCASGWYEIMPQGYACAGEGLEVAESDPKAEFEVPAPARDVALPYAYWFVKDDAVPEYHRLPSRDEQREAVAFSARYLELRAKNAALGSKLLKGELPNEVKRPAVLNRLLDRGFFVAATGIEERASRNFVRTVRGRYVKQAQLESREGTSFRGVEVNDERPLPIVWAVRSARPLLRRDRADGTVKFVDDADAEVIERQSIVKGWLGKENVGGTVYHRLEGDRFVKDWFFAVAEAVPKPKEIKTDEPWVHVNLRAQTLVAYRGATPVYATLVSTGLPDHATPPGLFTIHRKYVADTMANVGDTLDDRYSIEDVPWTQYFQGSVALHGAFWHSGFGLPRSHGCVNLAPKDAHWLFDHLWPTIPRGWLGVVADLTSFRESHVLITE
ncbi:MAG: L,D-transpeptidase [Polyangiales bacterium]